MYAVFFIGTAGSGKSLLTATLGEWLRAAEQDVTTVNLDPGVRSLPYKPDVDVRKQVKVDELMDEYRLGPNGALIMAADLIAGETEALNGQIESLHSDVILVDTPGQMELFAFRASGPYLADELMKGEAKVILYLFDSIFSLTPLNYVANLFLSSAVYNRFLHPQIHVLSKSDLPPAEEVDRILDWSTQPHTLEAAIEEKLEGEQRLLSRNMMQAITNLEQQFPLIPVSAKTNRGFVNLNTALERILSAGDKYTY